MHACDVVLMFIVRFVVKTFEIAIFDCCPTTASCVLLVGFCVLLWSFLLILFLWWSEFSLIGNSALDRINSGDSWNFTVRTTQSHMSIGGGRGESRGGEGNYNHSGVGESECDSVVCCLLFVWYWIWRTIWYAIRFLVIQTSNLMAMAVVLPPHAVWLVYFCLNTLFTIFLFSSCRSTVPLQFRQHWSEQERENQQKHQQESGRWVCNLFYGLIVQVILNSHARDSARLLFTSINNIFSRF